jgi:hypothetical protein
MQTFIDEREKFNYGITPATFISPRFQHQGENSTAKKRSI